MKYFSSNLKHLVKMGDLTFEKFAEKIGISSGALSSYVTGRVIPTLDKVNDMAQFFNVSLEDLVNKDLSKEGVEYKTGQNDDLIIELLMKEVKHLRKQISKNGGDETAADAAIEKAVKTLRKAEGKKKE